jgi:hypothetical protein
MRHRTILWGIAQLESLEALAAHARSLTDDPEAPCIARMLVGAQSDANETSCGLGHSQAGAVAPRYPGPFQRFGICALSHWCRRRAPQWRPKALIVRTKNAMRR